MRKTSPAVLLTIVFAILPFKSFAFNILQPGDAIIAIDVPSPTSSYPGGEAPGFGLDNDVTTKYLNFGEENSGFILDLPSAVTPRSFRMTSGNDAPERDPTSWEIYGFNGTVTELDNGLGFADPWTLVASGADTGLNSLVEPARNTGGAPQSFANTTAYNAFKMVFPTVRDANVANSMQYTDLIFFSNAAATIPIIATPNQILAIDADLPASQSNYPAAESPPLAIDGNPLTKYLNTGKGGSGFIVTPAAGGAPFSELRVTTANDAPGRDPLTFELYGTNETINSTDNSGGLSENWTLIDSGLTGLATDPGRDTPGPIVSVASPTTYSSYKVIFPDIRDGNECCMQVAEVEFLVPDLVAVEVNRDTGEVRIVADPGAGQNITFQSYEVRSSVSGAINDANWNSIAATNADPNDTWQETSTSGSRTEVAESDVTGNGADDGFTLTPGSGISLGNIWDRVPDDLQDVSLILLDTTGTTIAATVSYTGSAVVEGDYSGDGIVDINDWPQFRAMYGADFTGLTLAEAYLAGDLDGDYDNDIDDYNIFVKAAGGLTALFTVPEPSSLSLFAGLGLFLFGSRRFRRRLSRANLQATSLVGLVGIGLLFTGATPVEAQTQMNFAIEGFTPGFSIPANETNENGTTGDATTGAGPANLFDDTFLSGDFDMFYLDYSTEDPPNGTISEQYASIGDEDMDGNFEAKTFFMDYGSSISPNWFAYAPRLGGDPLADRVGKFEFWFSNTSFGTTVPTTAPDVTFSMLDGDSRLADNVIRPYPLGDTQSGQHVAARFTLSGDSAAQPGNNPGGHEFRFLTGKSAPIIEVDRSTGEITLMNTGDANSALNIQSYTIESPGNGLDVSGFDGVGGDAGFPLGNGTGNGWEIGLGSQSGRLAEAHFLNNSSLTAGNAGISLGNAYNIGLNTEDLVFKWTDGASSITTSPDANAHVYDGIVRYVGTPVISVLCDADGDLDCILDDIDAMYQLEGMAGQFDFDGSGVIDGPDVALWLAEASMSSNVANPTGRTHFIGDLNLDFLVNSSDLGLLLNNFNDVAGSAAAGVGYGGGDITMEGTVDSTDLGQLLNNFNAVGAASAVPEPCSQTLLAFAALGVLVFVRRR